jgi:prepilin-type N-terminal cleavage/methylation domain-containing protein/prepilin-type processing-associated H-X9-DG protein
MPSKKAFSIPEMLAVVAIIVIVLAMLLPALGSARRTGRSTVCLAMTHQHSVAHRAFLADNKTKLMAWWANGTALWVQNIEPYSTDKGIFLCPEADVWVTPDPGPRNRGSATSPWRWGSRYGGTLYGSYGLNGFVYDINDGTSNPSNFNGRDTPSSKDYWFGSKSAQIRRPSQTPFTADSNWYDAWPQDYQGPPADGLGISIGWHNKYTMHRFIFDRHPNKVINMSFVDGHSKAVPVVDLWKHRWSTKFQDRDVTLNW